MTRYTVEFWAGTDLRCDSSVDALSEVEALVTALRVLSLGSKWCMCKGWKVVIKVETWNDFNKAQTDTSK